MINNNEPHLDTTIESFKESIGSIRKSLDSMIYDMNLIINEKESYDFNSKQLEMIADLLSTCDIMNDLNNSMKNDLSNFYDLPDKIEEDYTQAANASNICTVFSRKNRKRKQPEIPVQTIENA